MFGAPSISTKWYVTHEQNGVTYYLAEANDNASKLTWSQIVHNALRFSSAHDAEKVIALIKSHRKHNKNVVYKVR